MREVLLSFLTLDENNFTGMSCNNSDVLGARALCCRLSPTGAGRGGGGLYLELGSGYLFSVCEGAVLPAFVTWLAGATAARTSWTEVRLALPRELKEMLH